MQRFNASTLLRFNVLLLVFVGVCFGRPLVVMAADPNACGPQQDYRLAVPGALPVDPNADPNLAEGVVLGPVPGDPNAWDLAAGQWKRPWARICDPEGDTYRVEFLGGTSAAEVQVDPANGLWTFAAEAVVGLNAWCFRASDEHEASRIVWIVGFGLLNEPPVLE